MLSKRPEDEGERGSSLKKATRYKKVSYAEIKRARKPPFSLRTFLACWKAEKERGEEGWGDPLILGNFSSFPPIDEPKKEAFTCHPPRQPPRCLSLPPPPLSLLFPFSREERRRTRMSLLSGDRERGRKTGEGEKREERLLWPVSPSVFFCESASMSGPGLAIPCEAVVYAGLAYSTTVLRSSVCKGWSFSSSPFFLAHSSPSLSSPLPSSFFGEEREVVKEKSIVLWSPKRTKLTAERGGERRGPLLLHNYYRRRRRRLRIALW